MKGFTLFELIVFTATVALLGVVLVVTINTREPEDEKTYCMLRENYPQRNLPARCLKYFK